MANIKPFKALLYNKEKITDFSKVTCPPYDIISRQAQDDFYRSSPYNMIRLLLNKETKKDTLKNNRYTRAAKNFNDWQRRKILVQDAAECFYLHKHIFKINEKQICRYGIFGLLRLEKSVRGHERTKLAPKKDRLKLIRKVKANLSPIFVLFSDTHKIMDKVFRKYAAKKKPFLHFSDYDNNIHYLWRIDDAKINKKFINDLKGRQAFIADGHHRYAVGARFSQEMQKRHKNSKNASWRYIMSYFTDINSNGLIILPVHRLIKSMDKTEPKYVLDILEKYFRIYTLQNKEKFLSFFEKKRRQRHCFGFYMKKSSRFYILQLRDKKVIKKLFPRHKKEFHDLDVFVLEELVLKKLLGIRDKAQIDYNQDAQKALEAVDNKEADFVFLVSPTKIEDVKRIALINGHMPPKSTYFYPKVLSGLTIHKF